MKFFILPITLLSKESFFEEFDSSILFIILIIKCLENLAQIYKPCLPKEIADGFILVRLILFRRVLNKKK